MTEEKITLDENINIFSDELKRCFSKDDIEEIHLSHYVQSLVQK